LASLKEGKVGEVTTGASLELAAFEESLREAESYSRALLEFGVR